MIERVFISTKNDQKIQNLDRKIKKFILKEKMKKKIFQVYCKIFRTPRGF